MTVRSKAGFSLTELTVVVAIILIVSGLSLPSLTRVIDTVRVKTAAQQAASLYQQARIRATQDDAYYNVLLANGNSSICLDLDGDGQCGGNDPITTLGSGAVLSNAGIPVQLDSTVLGFTPLSADSSTTYTPQGTTVSALGWNSRGLPCQKLSSTSPCSNWVASGGGGPVGWIQYVQLQRPTGTQIAAVVVSPSGRIKIWNYSPSDGTGVSWR
jgi:prepilin-type N-terminal cleavage/methylation domain-containing protein